MTSLSLVAEFDDIRRCQAVLYDGTAEEQFLRFAALQEECRLQWLAAVQEAQRLQRELDDALKQMSDLETKLYHARRLVDTETKLRKDAQQEKVNLENKLITVANVIQDPNFPRETREKFAFIKQHSKKRKSRGGEEKLGNDINSTGSFLSDLSVTQSENDFLDADCSRTYKKSRVSVPNRRSSLFLGSKPRGSRGLNESRRVTKPNNTCTRESNIDVGNDEQICATTKVTIPNKGNGPIVAESIIEALPSALINEKPVTSTSTPRSKNIPNSENGTETKTSDEENGSPEKFFSPTAPPLNELHENFNNINGTPKSGNSAFRHHNFVSKTFIKTDNCSHCNKKIRFGSLALKCKNCRVSSHIDCKDQLTACVPSSAGGTPTFKGVMGFVAQYAPSIPPMVPALIVHCVTEIEKRGLTEVGIYRIPGSEREVKSLKEKFLRGKTPPFLGNTDVHVLCGCIKDFLRSLREPLIPTYLWDDFSNAVKNDEEKFDQLNRAINRLPQANRDTLAYLILHFQRVSKCEDIKMPINNLARVFGPTIVGYSSPDPDRNAIFSETMIQFQVMEALLNISESYWSKYVPIIIDDINTPVKNSYVGSQPTPYSTIKADSIRTLYTTPFKGSLRKEKRKFYGTPPYSSKKF